MTQTLAPAPRKNAIRSPLNALFFELIDRYAHRKVGGEKQRVFSGMPDTIVEIGAGTGANFRYLEPGTRVVAVEPNPSMSAGLQRSADRWGIRLDHRLRPAEQIDLPDASVDAVICSLTLCSVADSLVTLGEVRRVLRPGGRFAFVEHVPAGARSLVRGVQELVRRPWRWAFEGCDVLNDTRHAVHLSGFASVDMHPFTMKSAFVPVRSMVAGVAIA